MFLPSRKGGGDTGTTSESGETSNLLKFDLLKVSGFDE